MRDAADAAADGEGVPTGRAGIYALITSKKASQPPEIQIFTLFAAQTERKAAGTPPPLPIRILMCGEPSASLKQKPDAPK